MLHLMLSSNIYHYSLPILNQNRQHSLESLGFSIVLHTRLHYHIYKLDKFLLLKVTLQVPQLQHGNHNAYTKGHNTKPCNPCIRPLAYFPHLCLPESIKNTEETIHDQMLVITHNCMEYLTRNHFFSFFNYLDLR